MAFIASAFGIHLISTIPLHCKAEDVVRSTPSVKETRKLDGGKGYVKTQLIGFLDLYIYIYIYIYILHVSAALLGHRQVTRCMIQNTLQYTGSSCATYFYSYQRDLVVVMFCVTIAV